jgi:aryl-alcohol dehydrogenase-like predicted oxidoreductase
MDTRALGNSDLNITPVGFGAWAIGGGNWEFGWGPQDDQHSIEAIHAALDAGMNWIDTAPAYGLGRSEEVVGRAVKGRADKPYIFTKCSLLWDDKGFVVNNLKAQSVRREVEASLRRLQVDVIDLYQIHWPNPDDDIEEGWAEMARLKDEGKVRWIGVSNFDVLQMKRAQAIAPITSLQPPYSLLARDVEYAILPYAREHGIGVINYSPMASGLLTGAMTRERIAAMPDDDWRKDSSDFKDPKLGRALALADKLGEIAARHQVSTGVVAVAWTLANPAITGAIVGARNARQVEGVEAALDFRLTPEEVAEIESFQKAQG